MLYPLHRPVVKNKLAIFWIFGKRWQGKWSSFGFFDAWFSFRLTMLTRLTCSLALKVPFPRGDSFFDSLVHDEGLELADEVPGDAEDLPGLVLLGHLVEEPDDVREVHVAVEDDVAVVLHQRQRHEQVEVGGDHLPGRPVVKLNIVKVKEELSKSVFSPDGLPD